MAKKRGSSPTRATKRGKQKPPGNRAISKQKQFLRGDMKRDTLGTHNTVNGPHTRAKNKAGQGAPVESRGNRRPKFDTPSQKSPKVKYLEDEVKRLTHREKLLTQGRYDEMEDRRSAEAALRQIQLEKTRMETELAQVRNESEDYRIATNKGQRMVLEKEMELAKSKKKHTKATKRIAASKKVTSKRVSLARNLYERAKDAESTIEANKHYQNELNSEINQLKSAGETHEGEIRELTEERDRLREQMGELVEGGFRAQDRDRSRRRTNKKLRRTNEQLRNELSNARRPEDVRAILNHELNARFTDVDILNMSRTDIQNLVQEAVQNMEVNNFTQENINQIVQQAVQHIENNRTAINGGRDLVILGGGGVPMMGYPVMDGGGAAAASAASVTALLERGGAGISAEQMNLIITEIRNGTNTPGSQTLAERIQAIENSSMTRERKDKMILKESGIEEKSKEKGEDLAKFGKNFGEGMFGMSRGFAGMSGMFGNVLLIVAIVLLIWIVLQIFPLAIL